MEEIKKIKSENKVVDYSDPDALPDLKTYPIAYAPRLVEHHVNTIVSCFYVVY